MMRLLMTTDTVGGVWTYCMELCAALRPYGVKVALASMGGALSAEQRRQLAELPNVTLYESHYKLCWMADAWDDVAQAGEWLLALERELQPDIVHLNDLAHGALGWHSPVVIVGHSCVMSWWEAVKKRPAPSTDWSRYRTTVRASLQAADRVVAPSTAMMDALIRHYGPVAAPSVIFNGRDFPALLPTPEAKISFMEPLILSAGRLWDEAKNVSALAAIAADLPWKLHVAGASNAPGADDSDLAGLHHLGLLAQPALAERLRRASIYVAPARYEPFGLGILEAARSGCALVLGDIDSLREIWGDAAEYVDPDNPQEIQRALEALIVNPSRLSWMMERAWRRAQRYSASRMAAGYVHLYQALRHPLRASVAPLTPQTSGRMPSGVTP